MDFIWSLRFEWYCAYVCAKSLQWSDSLQPHGTVACQAPLPTGCLQARILEWVPCSTPGDLPDPRIKTASPVAPALQADYHWATREALEWYWPHWIREMTGSHWISSQNVRFISIWRAYVFKILISPGIWSCWFSGPGKQHLFSIFSVSSQSLDNLWVLSGHWAETACHYHPIWSGVLTPAPPVAGLVCIFTHLPLFVFRSNMCEGSKGHSLFALPYEARSGDGLDSAPKCTQWPHPSRPSPGPTKNPWPLNHAFQTFSIITVRFNIPIHYTHTHVRRWESKHLTSGGAKRLTHQNLVLSGARPCKPPAVPEVNPFVAESERGCGERVSQGSRRRA